MAKWICNVHRDKKIYAQLICICVLALELQAWWYIISGSNILFHYIMYLYSFSLKSWNEKIRIIFNNKSKYMYKSLKEAWTALWLWYCHMFCTDLYSIYTWSVSLISASLRNRKEKVGVGRRGIWILLINNLPAAGVHSILPYTWAFQVKLVWLGTSN